MNPTEAIRVDGLHKHYKQLHALKGISFGVKAGDFFAIYFNFFQKHFHWPNPKLTYRIFIKSFVDN